MVVQKGLPHHVYTITVDNQQHKVFFVELQIQKLRNDISTIEIGLTSFNRKQRHNAEAKIEQLRQELEDIYAPFNV